MQNKQKRFADEYIIDFNATKAAERAGYNANSAYSQGHRLLKNDEIKKYIEVLLEERRKNTTILQARIIAELEKIAFADMKDFADWDNTEVRLKDSKDVDGTVINEITIDEMQNGTKRKIKLHDKIKALQELEKITRLVNTKDDIDDREQVITVRLED